MTWPDAIRYGYPALLILSTLTTATIVLWRERPDAKGRT